MAENKKISQMSKASTLLGNERIETVQGGLNVYTDPEQLAEYVGSGVTREFNRAWSSELLFDKNEIDYAPHELSANLTYTVASSGHLTNQFSVAVQTIITDGTFVLDFEGFAFIYGIDKGDTPTAGTYQIFFMYRNGVATVQFTEPSSEAANLTPLAAPANFEATPDAVSGDSELDLSWDAVTDAASYEIQVSSAGGAGPWVALTNPAAGVTSFAHTGLAAGTTYHYRIRAIGNGTTFSDSPWSITAQTTEDGGDVTAPVATFNPVSGVTTIPINKTIIITMDEPIIDDDGVTVIDNSNIDDYIVVKQTNSGGTDIPFVATIDVSKTIITITPAPIWGDTQLVYWAISGIEDVNGNAAGVQSSLFTSTDYTLFNGTSNRVDLTDILDSVFTANDTNFWLEATIQNQPLVGVNPLCTKYAGTSNERALSWWIQDTDVFFVWYSSLSNQTINRVIKWTNVITDQTEKTLVLKYDGSIDTNNGLDRVVLEIDGVVAGSKSLFSSGGSLGNIANSPAHLAIGGYLNSSGVPSASVYFGGEMKDFIIRSTGGTVVELNIPLIRTGTDISGNGHNGTWA